jgi:hypothetical protein
MSTMRFKLQTVFAATAVLALALTLTKMWISRTAKYIEDRRHALKSPTSEWSYRVAGAQSGVSVPWFRRLMGDEPVETVLLGTWAAEEEFQRAKRLFPEAEVERNDPFWEHLMW